MEPWYCQVHVLGADPELPRPLAIGYEARRDASYAFHGATRRGPEHICLQLTLSGEGRFADAAGIHRLPPGTAFCCNVRDPATAYYYPPEAGGEPWEFVFIGLGGPLGLAWFAQLIQRHGGVYQLGRNHPLVQRLLAMREHVPVARLPAFGAAKLVVDLLAALEVAAQSAGTSRGRQLLDRALAHVHPRRQEPLTVGDVAAALKVSREHLSRVFTRELGLPAHAYLQRQRMLLACEWLRQPDRTVKAIARDLGFAGAAQFSRAFRQVLQMTPTEFRRRGTPPVF